MQSLAVRSLLFFLPALMWCQTVTGPVVRFKTTLGDIDVTLLPEVAPLTVANFLNYVNKGAFTNSIVHRSVAGFIWQGGGYQWRNNQVVQIPQDPAVRNEFNVSNTRGTLAMAKLGSDPNSATNQWFFNLANNSGNLDRQNGGFTVFGRVTNSDGLAVMDKIAAVPVPNGVFASPFDQIPLVDYRGTVGEANLVQVLSITQVESTPNPAITGIISASGFGAFPAAAPGSYIEIYGSNLAGEPSRGWAAGDFNGVNAPKSLDGVSVTVDGEAAFVNYVSPGLVIVQVPLNVPPGGPVRVYVTYRGRISQSAILNVKAVVPGLLAPATFKVNDKQYVVAVRPSSSAYISNGSVPGIAASPAIPGETLVFYGTGFGAVTPASVPIAGQIVGAQASIAAPVQFKIGGVVATVGYAGLAPGLVGLYQFNVTVPADAPSGDLAVELTVAGEVVGQSLVLPVAAP